MVTSVNLGEWSIISKLYCSLNFKYEAFRSKYIKISIYKNCHVVYDRSKKEEIMNRKVKKILEMNSIQEDYLEQALYRDIREMFLGEICSYMKSGREQYLEVRRIYYRTPDDILAAKRTVQKVCGKTLPDEDLVWLDKCIKAYFHKGSRRQPIMEEERRHLWEKQGRCCAICNQPINLQDLHVDHIVPWDYVGDELEDNLQALCAVCNERKSNHVAYAIRYLFMEKKGVS